MATIPLKNDERRKLVRIISKLDEVLTADDRVSFLEDCGLIEFKDQVKYDTTPREFASELVRVCQEKGTFTPTGEPALASVLTFLRDDLLEGQEAEREFVGGLLQQANPNVARAAQMRRRNPDFTGRVDALDRLTTALQEGRTVHLQGMGGAGKSELALQLAARVKDNFPGPALQVELQPDNAPANATSLLSQIIITLNPAARLPTTLNDLQQMAQEVMSNKRGILLLDNAAAPEQIDPVWEAARGWAILVTSRARFSLRGSVTEAVGELTEEESITLLAKLLRNNGRSTTSEALASLASACHRLALPLTVAAAYLGTTLDISVDKYVTLLQKRPAASLQVEGYENVFKVLGASIERLSKDNPKLSEQWHLLAHMPAPFDSTLAAALWGKLLPGNPPLVASLKRDTTAADLRELVRLGLLTYDDATKKYRLHDLWKTYGSEVSLYRPNRTLTDSAIRCHALTVLNHGILAQKLYNTGHQIKGLARFDTLWEHLDGAWRGLNTATDSTANYFLSQFAGSLFELLYLRLLPRSTIPYLEVGLATVRRLGERIGERINVGNLGIAYRDLAEVQKAISFYEQALSISREIGDKIGEGVNLGNLGIAYYDLGQMRKAISFYEQALSIAHEVGSKSNEGIDLGNLGIAFSNLGEIQKAISFYEQALSIAREVGDRSTEAVNLGNLGIAFSDLGEIQKAISFYEQALSIARKVGNKLVEGTFLSNLGNAYRDLGNIEKDVIYQHEALRIAQQLRDKNLEGQIFNNLGDAYAKSEQVEKAIDFYDQALILFTEILAERHRGISLWGLARAYHTLNNRDTALDYARLALVSYEKTEHPDLPKVQTAIAEWEAARANSSEP